MKSLLQIKSFTKRTIFASMIVAAAIVGIAFSSNAQAAGQNCDNNAVIYCGASSVNSLQNKYHNGVSGHNSASSIQHIYSYFGISGSDINSMGQYTVSGEVYRDGTVKVNGKVVATDAWTAGRQNISGSIKITYGGTTFYKRRPAVSFVSSPLAAFVVMRNGVFQFAILGSCGNPVIATAKPVPTPTHKPAPTPTPIPHHSVCIQNACVRVPGAGYNTCTSNANCHSIPTPIPHHYSCVQNACVQVSGAGYNTCTSNANCQAKPTICTPTPTPYHPTW